MLEINDKNKEYPSSIEIVNGKKYFAFDVVGFRNCRATTIELEN